MPVSRPRVARSRRRVGRPQGCTKRPNTSRPFVGLMRGRLFSSRRTHSLGHGEDSRLLSTSPAANPPTSLPPHTPSSTHTHRTAAAAPSLSILLGSGCPGSLGLAGLAALADHPEEGERGVGLAEITCQPGEHLHLLTCHCFPPNKVQSSGAAFREPPRTPRIPSPPPLVKLSALLPGWGPTAVPIPGWRALRICQ